MNVQLRAVAIIIIVCPLFFGCFTNFYLDSPLDANQKRITDHAEIVLRSGACIEAVDIKVGRDTTRFVIIGTDSLRQIRTNEIDKLIVKDHAAGIVGGFLAGGAIGTGAGLLLSSWTGEFNRREGSMAPIVYISGGLITGSIGGAIYWGIRGHHDNYIFPLPARVYAGKRFGASVQPRRRTSCEALHCRYAAGIDKEMAH